MPGCRLLGGFELGMIASDFSSLPDKISFLRLILSSDLPFHLPQIHFRHLVGCGADDNQIHNDKANEFNVDLDKVAIGGCSAGGHLSAVLAHMCRDSGLPLKFQLLSVPVCDLSMFAEDGSLKPDQPYASYNEFAECPPLPLERMSYFFKHFLQDVRFSDKAGKYGGGAEEVRQVFVEMFGAGY